MKIIAKRYVDNFKPGDELTAGRYDEAALGALIDKGHFAIVDDAEPATAALMADPEKAKAEADKRREKALAAFAAAPKDEGTTVVVKGPAEVRHGPATKQPAPAPEIAGQTLVIERIPEAESDTVTRVYVAEDETKSPAARAEAAEKSAKKGK